MNNLTKRNRLFGLKKLFSLQVIIVLLASLIVVSASPFQENWDLGKYKLLTSASRIGRVLRLSTNGQGLVYRFLSRVGGIAFEQTAKPDPKLAGEKIVLSYDPKRDDKSRLVVTVGGVNYYPKLADWMLIPIAKYADSEFTAIVSLMDEESKRSGDYIVLHPDLKNTLLGLRLIQGDMLLLDPEDLRHFPSRGGRVVMGQGESLPTEPDSLNAASELKPFWQQVTGKAEALLITDEGVDITFSISGGDFNLTGDHYYYLWNIDYGEAYQKYKQQVDPLWQNYYKLLEQGKKKEAFKQIDKILAIKLPEYKEAYGKFAEQRDSLLAQARVLVKQGKRQEAEKLYRQAKGLEPPIVEVRSLTDYLKDKREVLRKVNPHLYDEINDTMRYAALFRYVKANNPSSWKAFHAQIKDRVPEPSIVTPYSWEEQK